MLKTESLYLTAPAIADRVLQVRNDSSIEPHFIVENKSATLSAAIEYQESDDGNTWTTIVGSSQTVNPSQADGQIVTSNKRLLALFAQGNVPLLVHVVRQYNNQVQPI